LAALQFKVKFQQKILRSKENTLTPDIIKKHLDFAVPRLILDTLPSKEWEAQICQQFDSAGYNDLSIDEAMEEFLRIYG
jgi:hypothetical protein